MNEDSQKKDKNRNVIKTRNRDNPEQFPTDKESIMDMHESQQNVDPIPLEDLKIEQQDEKKKTKTKDSSSSERKYK